MEEKNLLEKLVEVSPGMEIWWDSSPLIFKNWCRKLLEKAAPGDREVMRRQFGRMFDQSAPEKQLFRGVTTNPPLSLQAIQDDPAHWEGVAKTIIAENKGLDAEALFWSLYKQVVKRGSDIYLPLFKKTGYKEGFLSGQVDPRKVFDKDAMLSQALELAAINPNVMIKVPGSREGYDVIEELTARGISTNNTLTFVLPQLVDCARTVKKGLEKAKRNGVDLSRWRSVITHMESRYGDLGGLRDFGCGKRHPAQRGRSAAGGTGDLQEGLPFSGGKRPSQQDALLFPAPGSRGERCHPHLASGGKDRGLHRGHLPAALYRSGAEFQR